MSTTLPFGRLPIEAGRPLPASPLRGGDVVADKYRVDGIIAWGGMGVVCSATHLELETRVAIKALRVELAGESALVARFLNEARAAAALSSPNVARVLDVGRLRSGVPYLVMEQLTGPTLAELMRARGPLPIDEAVGYLLRVCAGLSEAHAKGITHRDVKPENLVFTQEAGSVPVLKVVDFGISKVERDVASLTRPGESLGSPRYMSPEQMLCSSTVDSRTDIWSLGVVLYELLAGHCPFEGESLPEICSRVLHAGVTPIRTVRPDVPVRLEQVILRCLEKMPARRPRTANELAAELAPYTRTPGWVGQGGQTAVPPPSPSSTMLPYVDTCRGELWSMPGPVTETSRGAYERSFADLEDEPAPIPMRRRFWPLIFVVGGCVCILVLAGLRMRDDARLVPHVLRSPRLQPDSPTLDVARSAIEPRLNAPSIVAAGQVTPADQPAAKAAEPPTAERDSVESSADRSTRSLAPTRRRAQVRDPQRAAPRSKARHGGDDSLTPREITRRKAAYEEYLRRSGLQRASEVRVRTRPDGTTEIVE